MMTDQTVIPTYTSYLLRLRQQHSAEGGEEERQIMLRRVDSEEQYYFTDMEKLLHFLETGVEPNGEENETNQPSVPLA